MTRGLSKIQTLTGYPAYYLPPSPGGSPFLKARWNLRDLDITIWKMGGKDQASAKGASCPPNEVNGADRKERGQPSLSAPACCPQPWASGRPLSWNSPVPPRAVVREHGKGQPSQCMEDTLRSQHLPGMRALALPPQQGLAALAISQSLPTSQQLLMQGQQTAGCGPHVHAALFCFVLIVVKCV